MKQQEEIREDLFTLSTREGKHKSEEREREREREISIDERSINIHKKSHEFPEHPATRTETEHIYPECKPQINSSFVHTTRRTNLYNLFKEIGYIGIA